MTALSEGTTCPMGLKLCNFSRISQPVPGFFPAPVQKKPGTAAAKILGILMDGAEYIGTCTVEPVNFFRSRCRSRLLQLGSNRVDVVKYFCPRLIFGALAATIRLLRGHKIRPKTKCTAIMLGHRGLIMDFWQGLLKPIKMPIWALKKPAIEVKFSKMQKVSYFTLK